MQRLRITNRDTAADDTLTAMTTPADSETAPARQRICTENDRHYDASRADRKTVSLKPHMKPPSSSRRDAPKHMGQCNHTIARDAYHAHEGDSCHSSKIPGEYACRTRSSRQRFKRFKFERQDSNSRSHTNDRTLVTKPADAQVLPTICNRGASLDEGVLRFAQAHVVI